MSDSTLRTMGQQSGRRSWAEPWKIKMVEPIHMTGEQERREALRSAGYNTFLCVPKMSILICSPTAAPAP